VLTAHYDGLGRAKGRPPGPQSILNGADDNASGIAALLDVASELSRGPRPKRSVIFAAVSGEERGLWGSDILSLRPPVPIASIVANVNMDMIGRARADSVFVTGRRQGWLGPIAERAIARNRYGLTLLDEAALERRFPGERADDRSDHANFRKRGVPAIAFFTGWHDDYHETTDDFDKVNYDALARIASLVRDITLEIANAPIRR
jgi:Zn-dependent M28 family amino/carboxypeptidase